MIVLEGGIFLIGLFLVLYTFISAARTFVLPRSVSVKLAWIVFSSVRKFFNLIMQILPTYEQRDSLMAIYAPLSLLLMVPSWLLLTAIGYALMFWSMGTRPFSQAFLLSGSSILTLGFATGSNLWQTLLVFTEAAIGMILVAMLISYLPTMYTAFSQREEMVSLLEVRAGIPPTAPELVWRLYRLKDAVDVPTFWEAWERWFTAIDENHTSLAALVFFRSPRAHQSWITAAGAVLDGAALFVSAVAGDVTIHPSLVMRAGIMALRHIADVFSVTYNADPHFPTDAISVSRVEFDRALERLERQGVALRPDRELAWQNFAGWRVNYDSVLMALAKLTMAPETSWLAEYTFVPPDPTSGQTGGSLEKAD